MSTQRIAWQYLARVRAAYNISVSELLHTAEEKGDAERICKALFMEQETWEALEKARDAFHHEMQMNYVCICNSRNPNPEKAGVKTIKCEMCNLVYPANSDCCPKCKLVQ